MSKSDKYGLVSLTDDQFENLVKDFRSGKLSEKDTYAMWWNKRTIFHGDLLELHMWTTLTNSRMWKNEVRDLAIKLQFASLLYIETHFGEFSKNKFTKTHTAELLLKSKKYFENKYYDMCQGNFINQEFDIIKKLPPISEWKEKRDEILKIIERNKTYFSKQAVVIWVCKIPSFKFGEEKDAPIDYGIPRWDNRPAAPRRVVGNPVVDEQAIEEGQLREEIEADPIIMAPNRPTYFEDSETETAITYIYGTV